MVDTGTRKLCLPSKKTKHAELTLKCPVGNKLTFKKHAELNLTLFKLAATNLQKAC
jgi:hypothetical protein